jgi:hypothetical protein
VSEPENFLSRWARLKREAAEATETAATPDAAASDASADASRPAEPADAANAPPAPAPVFDISTLPSIESITATTDIRAFLAPGVPPDLARAALRRVWVADPAIRDFIGIAENQWDFNDPNAIPGFGSLGPLDDVRRLVAQVIGELHDEREDSAVATEEISAAAVPDSESLAAELPEADSTAGELPAPGRAQPAGTAAAKEQRPEVIAAVQQTEASDEPPATTDAPARRSHGGALPR